MQAVCVEKVLLITYSLTYLFSIRMPPLTLPIPSWTNLNKLNTSKYNDKLQISCNQSLVCVCVCPDSEQLFADKSDWVTLSFITELMTSCCGETQH